MARSPTSQLRVSFLVDTKGLTTGFRRATAATDRYGRSTGQVDRSTGRLGTTLGRATVAAAGAAAAFVPLSLAISQAARSTIEFDRSMRNVNSIAQLGEGQFQGLSKSVLELAGPTAQAPRTLADGLYDLVSSGFQSREALQVLEVSAKAATAGLTTTEVASKTVAAALNAYRLPAKRASVISDILFRTVDRGVISFEQLSSDIGDVLPFASSLGVGLEEVGASIATMTKAGIGSAETMTRVKNVMVTLLKPGDDLSAAMKSVGFESGEAMIQSLGFQGTLDALIKTTDGSKNAVAGLFPNIRALGGALALTGQNSAQASEDLAGMREAAGATDRALSQQSESIYFQWQRLKATAEALAIEVGSKLVPSIREVLKVLSDDSLTIAERFSEVRKRVIEAIQDLAPAAAEAAGQVGVVIAQSMGRAFVETGLLGKLAVTAFLVKAFGGPKALIAGGVAVGGYIQAGIAASQMKGGALAYFTDTKALARGFGRSAAISTSVAAVGAAQVAAMSFGKALLRFIPGVAAVLGIGEVLMTAIAGDLKSAAIKGAAGGLGAVIGGIIGSIVPGIGTAIGASVGGGLGVLGGSLLESIVGGAENEAPTFASRMAATVDRLAGLAAKEREAYQRLGRSSDFLSDARNRQANLAGRVRSAEQALAQARQRFGANSDQAAAAERRLAKAKNAVARASRNAQTAERVHGAEREATKVILRQNVTAQKLEIRQLLRKENAARRAWEQDKNNVDLARRYRQAAGLTRKAQDKLNESYDRAGRQIGPQFEASLRKIDGRAVAIRRALRRLPPLTDQIGRSAETGFGLFGDQVGFLSREVRESTSRINRNNRGMATVQGDSLDRMLDELRDKIGFVDNLGTPQIERRGGGKITGSTKTVVAAVSPGELISYGNHEIIVPGKPEPRDSVIMNLPVGAKVFTHDGQMRMALGASQAQALRDQAPHFAAGGIVRPTISGGSTQTNRYANKTVGVLHTRAQKKWRENMVTDLLGAVRLASRFGLSVSSGYRAGDDGYHGIDRARDFVGSASEMYDFAKFIGTRFGARLLELIYSPLGWSIKNGARTAPYAVADHYDHVHVAMRRGGKVKNINRIWPESNSAYGNWGGPTLPSYVVAALAQAAGMPGKTMEQVTRGESGAHRKNSARPGATGIDPGGTKGHGLWMITSGYNEDLAAKAGGWRKMLNPVVNAWAAAQIYRRQGLGAWYGTGSVTGNGLNYTGKYDIRNALGGLSFSGALYRATNGRLGTKPKSIPKIKKGARRLDRRTDRLASGAGPGARKALARADRLAARAMAAADRGEVTQARELMKRAQAIVARVGGRSGGGSKPPATTPQSSGGIPARVRDLVKRAGAKGISFDTRESLLSSALSIAQGTEGTADDLLVLEKQRKLQQRRRARALGTLKRANQMLGKKGLSKKERAKWQRKRNEALQSLGLASSEIASINEQIRDVNTSGGGDAEVDLAEAMKELAEAIQEQNRLQSSVQATSSREALRMLSDVISGQIVGKRTPVGQTPIGVRY